MDTLYMSIHATVPHKKARESVQILADGLIAISGQMTGVDNAKTAGVARQQQVNPELDLSLGMDENSHTEPDHPENGRTGA